MNQVSVFVIGVGATVAVGFIVVGYLKSTLRKILVDLCGTEDRANFWMAFANVTLILTPTAVALGARPEAGQNSPLTFQVGAQMEWALIGLVASIVTLGFVISLFIPRAPVKQ
jgi:hypothetical protein